ncbi:MAG: phosphorylase [Bacteroidia bacterium]|nr:phosphorylase [Bacteroidia bacterium]
MRPSELPLRPDGSVYHIAMKPGQASHRCLLLGDPGRVALVESLLDEVQHRGGNREFVWLTGLYRGKSITALGTGIGADNTEIALVELDALHNIDLGRGVPFPTHKKLYFLRVGTCGLLQPEASLGAAVFSSSAVGVDPLPLFYETSLDTDLAEALDSYCRKVRGVSCPLPWYAVSATPFFLSQARRYLPAGLPWVEGITYSAPGFYGPQGRIGRGRVRFPAFADLLASFSYQGIRIQNIEMEAAPLYALAHAFGHEAGALCLGIAHRQKGEFIYQDGGPSPEESMKRILEIGLEWLSDVP